MHHIVFILLLIPLLSGLYYLASPITLLCCIVLLAIFDLNKAKEVYAIVFTAALCFLGLLVRLCFMLVSEPPLAVLIDLTRNMLTCSLTLTVFILIKFMIFTCMQNQVNK